MWPKLVAQLAQYPSVVLTGLDAEGYPFSLRCQPQPDSATATLRLTLPSSVNLQPGPACILGHYHDDQLWNQTNLMVRGTLAQSEGGWAFKPGASVEGAGAGMSMIRQIRDGRGAAKRYLEKRKLSRPKIPWDALKAIYEKAQKK